MQLLEEYPHVHSLFDEFSENELNGMEILKLPSKSILIQKGDFSHSVYIIIDGICDVLKDMPNGSTIINYKLSSPDIIGLSELLTTPSRRISTIITCSPVTAIRIPAHDFFLYYEKHKKFSLILLQNIIQRLHKALQFSAECKTNSSDTNIRYYLCNRYDYYRMAYPATYTGYVKINETRQIMSDYLGLEIRTLNRYFSMFKDAGDITVIKGKIHINARQYHQLSDKI